MEKPKKRPIWHYLILVFGIITLIGILTSDDEEKLPPRETIELKSGLKFKLLDRTECTKYTKFTNGWSGDMTSREFIYVVENFDKDNPMCWIDLESFGLVTSTPQNKDSIMGTVIVHFMDNSDSIYYKKSKDNCGYELNWDNSPYWIANYLYSDAWLGGDPRKELIRHWK
jgi:hypothetical protein